MRLVNADGGEVELSGNGVRCLAAYACRRSLAPPRHTVFTPAGPRPVDVQAVGPTRYRVETGLGPAILRSDRIPMALAEVREPVVDEPLPVDGETVRVTATSLGNPHCAVFLEEVADDALVARLGPALERHEAFPARTNVEFVTVRSRGEIRVRFWERGVGPTLASGTGAASAFVAAVLKGLVDRRVTAVCDGGSLDVSWPEGGDVRQTGEVEVLFEGEWLA
jgi:diaminopimelate epimerase